MPECATAGSSRGRMVPDFSMDASSTQSMLCRVFLGFSRRTLPTGAGFDPIDLTWNFATRSSFVPTSRLMEARYSPITRSRQA